MNPKTYYPDGGAWAVMARVAFLVAVIVVTFASLAPLSMVPQVLPSRHLEHFAAFYFTTLIAATAFPRLKILTLGGRLALFAALLELTRMAPSQHRIWGVLDWEADFGGIIAALAPVIVEKFRSRFDPRVPK